GATMAREEALKIGKVIADNWWANSRSIILSKQHIEKKKAWQQKLFRLITVPEALTTAERSTSVSKMIPRSASFAKTACLILSIA
ncbi:hypothetical protein, partial [Enterococcus faecium]